VAIAALWLVGCAAAPISSRPALERKIAFADSAYRELHPENLLRYNSAIADLAREMERSEPTAFAAQLERSGVSLNLPSSKLPLVRFHLVRDTAKSAPATFIGVPMLIEYDTKHAPLHPPEGMLLPATALYTHDSRGGRLSLLVERKSIVVRGQEYPLAADYGASGWLLRKRAARLRKSGFMSMIRPSRIERKPQIYLIDPYHPDKIPILMVHGLQSTPVAFVPLVNALHSESDIRERYQIWQFHYATGLPVLVNAAILRDELAKTIRLVDPHNRHAATKRIVVLGHSMGGIISHTLVSSSGDELWKSLFTRAPEKLRGNSEAIERLEDVMFFRRNPRVRRIIFMATPHRGSPMSDSWIGGIGKALSRLRSPVLESGLNEVARSNPSSMTPAGLAFYNGESFTAVRTLSARNPSLIALSTLPIGVPFHSIMGQKKPGPTEQGTDGVVPYSRSHLRDAASELVVRGGHNVFNHPDAAREVVRILRLELRRPAARVRRGARITD